jgi:hypothetical protein
MGSIKSHSWSVHGARCHRGDRSFEAAVPAPALRGRLLCTYIASRSVADIGKQYETVGSACIYLTTTVEAIS